MTKRDYPLTLDRWGVRVWEDKARAAGLLGPLGMTEQFSLSKPDQNIRVWFEKD